MASLPSDAPRPRICRVRKDYPEQDYGFNLHADRNKGQFIGAVDSGSPASVAGLRTGDRIVAVNGTGVVGESHKQVVARIKQNPLECALVVIDEQGEAWYRQRNMQIPFHQLEINGDTASKNGEHASRENSGSGDEKVTGNGVGCGDGNGGGGGTGDGNGVGTGDTKANGNGTEVSKSSGELSSPTMERPMKPKLCRLLKSSDEVEFGFNLHAEKNIGHYIGKVDSGSVAEKAGLVEGHRIVGVNGIIIYPTTPNREVAQIIRSDPMKSELLIVSPEVDQWYKEHGKQFTFQDADLIDQQSQPCPTLTKSSSSPTENSISSNGEKVKKMEETNDQVSVASSELSRISVSPKLSDNQKDVNNGCKIGHNDESSNLSQSSRLDDSSALENGGHDSSTHSQQDWMNLSASELRERVSRHKKTDPRTHQLSLLQKYEIVHNL